MMGWAHAWTGVAVWLGGAAVADLAGHPQPAVRVLAGAAVCSGAALIPDFDHPNSTAAHSLGPVTRGLARTVSWISARVVNLTRTRTEPRVEAMPDVQPVGHDHAAGHYAHRYLTHTILIALAVGVALYTTIGLASAAVAVFVTAGLAWRALAPDRWGTRWDAFVAATAATIGACGPAALLALAPASMPEHGMVIRAVAWWYPTGCSWQWIAVAVGVGMLTHLGGDFLTPQGCPLLAPLIKWRGKRWYFFRLPTWLQLDTGGRKEAGFLRLVWVSIGLSVLHLTGADGLLHHLAGPYWWH